MKKRILFIINPISGIKRIVNFERIIQRKIDHTKFDVSIRYTEYKGHGSLLAREAVENRTDIVVAVGGDGTINEIATQLVHTDTIMGIIPAGSGNGMAFHLNIPIVATKAVKVINKLKTTKIDVCKLNDYHFFSVAGIGFDAKVAYDFNSEKHRGFNNYLKQVIKNYLHYKQDLFRISYSDTTIDKEAFFITFANSSQWGFNIKMAPFASIQDGLVDVCIFHKPPFYMILPTAGNLLTNQIDKDPITEYIHCSQVDISTKDGLPIYLHIDGDAVEPTKEVHVRVIPKALNMIVG